MKNLSLADVRRALQLAPFDAPAAQQKMMPVPRARFRPPDRPGQPRVGAVLLLLFAEGQELRLVLTRRRDDLQSHAGQISFPGGRREPGEPLEMTALRETQEEIGVPAAEITLLGALSTVYIMPSDFEVHPFVGWHPGRPILLPQEREVAAIIEAPLADLLDPANRREEDWDIRGFQLRVPFLQLGPHQVWGATAMILSEFLERLAAS
jgi:8-oxo-dGTP pyrophosphatase MutT (NUDIX family)